MSCVLIRYAARSPAETGPRCRAAIRFASAEVAGAGTATIRADGAGVVGKAAGGAVEAPVAMLRLRAVPTRKWPL